MPKIFQLPPQLINQIAAGEVVERPASVVKELVENALDADATNIEVDIEAGGTKLIKVRDNGCGIEPDDLPLAFEAHATSKIKTVEDLENISTLGFRGEALASISAVAKVQLTSKAEHFYEAFSFNPQTNERRPAAYPQGTAVEIRDLFYNTPARKRFLKTERTERAHIIQLIERLALSRDRTNFILRDGGKTLGVFTGSLERRIETIIGADFLKNAVHLSPSDNDSVMKVSGWAGLPTFNASEKQFIFLNGRTLRDKFINHVVREAYQDMLHVGRNPAYVLYLDFAPDLFDANAHPSKYEVRFRDGRAVHGFLFNQLRQALRTASTPIITALPEKPSFKHSTPTVSTFTSSYRPTAAITDSSKSNYSPPSRFSTPTFSALTLDSAPQNLLPEQPLGQALACVQDIFIVAENTHGLVIVDMHAAHERILYENFKKSLRSQNIAIQNLLIPQELTLSELALATAADHQDFLMRCGFKFFLRPNMLVLSAYPVILRKNAVATFEVLLEELNSYESTTAAERAIDEILSRIACHRAVRAHDKLSIIEMNQLLRDLENCSAGDQCNHGRPTWRQFSIDEIGQFFQRGK